MVKSKKLTCVITGKTASYAGPEEKIYICKEAKALLKKGYKIKDVRKLLDVPLDADDVPKDIVDAIEKEYQKTSIKVNDTNSQSLSTISTLTYDRSDEDVEKFIKTFILKKT